MRAALFKICVSAILLYLKQEATGDISAMVGSGRQSLGMGVEFKPLGEVLTIPQMMRMNGASI